MKLSPYILASVVSAGTRPCQTEGDCPYGGTCVDSSCVCEFSTCQDSTSVCSWEYGTFSSRCELLKKSCNDQRNIIERCAGPCEECAKLKSQTLEPNVLAVPNESATLTCLYNHPETPITMINAQNRPKVTWHKLTEAGEVRVAKSYNYQVKYGGGYKDIVELSLEPGNGNLFFSGIRSNDFGEYKCTVRIGDDVEEVIVSLQEAIEPLSPPFDGSGMGDEASGVADVIYNDSEVEILESGLEFDPDCDPIPDQCPEGEFNYNGDCFKINFCINPAIHNCSQGTECQLLDTFPFFQCAPLPDLCAANPCPVESACETSNDMTEYNCVCADGNAPTNNSCTRDPCDTAPCQTCEKCYNLADGEAICIKRAGYDHHSDECVDINECDNGFANCEPHADCVNLEGNFMCQCHDGFEKVDGTCRDIDECAISDPCDQICTNLSGSFECSCNSGYNLVDDTECEDINECEHGMCGENSSCSNYDGGYDCECDEGNYDSNANDAPSSIEEAEAASENTSLIPSCVDINECSFTVPYCGDNSICTDANEVGATCTCQDGFESDNNGHDCTDIDECTADYNSCDDDENSHCTNTIGSYICECNYGYAFGSDGICENIDECLEMECPGIQICEDHIGYAECICPSDGYIMVDGVCVDVDECNSNPCGGNQDCTNTVGSYQCSCSSGFRLSSVTFEQSGGQEWNLPEPNYEGSTPVMFEDMAVNSNVISCVDINECRQPKVCVDTLGEMSVCTNTIGSYSCSCRDGFITNDLGLCVDENECESGSHDCHQDAYCTNSIGDYACECFEGYSGDGSMCDDIDECTAGTHTCDVHAECSNRPGTFVCACDTGFEGDGYDCDDIDECEDYPCGDHQDCDNTVGSYECSCSEGFEENDNSECVDIDECALNLCHEDAICHNQEGTYACECKCGYTGDGSNLFSSAVLGYGCHLVNDCDANPCNDIKNSFCNEIDGCNEDDESYTCECNDGYFMSDGVCEDVNECDDVDTCGEHEACHNFDGGFKCTCLNGFTRDINGDCVDIDECLINPCQANAICINEPGSFECECVEGFEENDGSCSDIDECESNPCDSNAECINLVGSFECNCNEGYAMIDNICNNINECATENACQTNSACIDTEGSFSCICDDGYASCVDNDRECCDINECDDSSSCGENMYCVNFAGGYECKCMSGFAEVASEGSGNGDIECVDIDECSTGKLVCGKDSSCVNNIGSASCECNDGFELNGGSCEDVDECASADICGDNSECTNSEGSFSCVCLSGYVQFDGGCIDMDECIEEIDECQENSLCVNDEPGFHCECVDGYELDEFEMCLDVNECLSSPCGQNADCANTEGSFECSCKVGFAEGNDGCVDVDECQGNPCGGNANCNNNVGSFSCSCNTGLQLGDDNNCYDILECADAEELCGDNSVCIETFGSYECKCRSGYEKQEDGTCGDIKECDNVSSCPFPNSECIEEEGGFSCDCASDGFMLVNENECKNINECEQNENSCPENTICKDTIGSFVCECASGYDEDITGCVNINECELSPICDDNSKCIDTDGSYECICKDGYATMAGNNCANINECALGNHNCDQACVDTDGSFTCACKEGFTLNENVCEPMATPTVPTIIDIVEENVVNKGVLPTDDEDSVDSDDSEDVDSADSDVDSDDSEDDKKKGDSDDSTVPDMESKDDPSTDSDGADADKDSMLDQTDDSDSKQVSDDEDQQSDSKSDGEEDTGDDVTDYQDTYDAYEEESDDENDTDDAQKSKDTKKVGETDDVALDSDTQAPTSPSQSPTQSPTQTPTQSSRQLPTQSPTELPTESPTQSPTDSPTQSPTQSPTDSPTQSPTQSPTGSPTQSPSQPPTQSPTQSPDEATTWSESATDSSISDDYTMTDYPSVSISLPEPTTEPESGALCPANWVGIGDYCYFYSRNEENFEDARAICQSLGGDVVHGESSFDQRITALARGSEVWLGMVQEDDNMPWMWINGQAPQKIKWSIGQPNNFANNDNCSLLANGHANDIPCDYKIRFICQAKSVSCSYPSVLPEHAQLVTDIAGSEFFALKQMIQFQCPDNKVLMGNPTITCENDGFFTAPEFSCKNRTVSKDSLLFYLVL